MPEQRLQPLRRETLLDEPGRAEMPKGVEPILCPALPIHDIGGALEPIEAPVCDVGVPHAPPLAVWKDEVERPLRAGCPPFLERVHNHRRHWDLSIAGR